MKTPSLAWSLLVALVTGVLLAISVSLASLFTLRSITHEQSAVLLDEASDLAAVQHLLALSERRARYARTWLLTQEPSVKQALEKTREEWRAQLLQLERILSSRKEQALLARVGRWQQASQELMDRLLEQRARGASPEELELQLETELAHVRLALDQALAELLVHERELLRDAIQEQERTRLRAITRLGVGTLGAVLASGLLGGLVVHSLREHRRAEQEVRRSEARFRATFNQAAVGIAHVGLEGRWLRLNERYLEILGYSSEELKGRLVEDFSHPDDVAAGLENVRRLLAGEFSTYAMEKRYLRKDHSLVWVNLTVSLVRDEAGRPQYILVVAEDITRRKALEEERVLLLAETREALRLREEFLSVASHELRTPLTPLSLRLQMLLREAREQGDSPFARRVVERVEVGQQQIQRMTRLIDELLDASHVSAGLLGLTLEDVDLAAVVREVAGRFVPVAVRAGCALVVEADTAVVGRWDRRRLEQVVSSLLSNALKFGAGSPVHLRVESDGQQARLTVRDEGIGISPEELPRIFGRFNRGVSDRHYGGLGLGLFLTRYVVQSLGGEVTAESTPGQGATFLVQLPLRLAQVGANPEEVRA